MPAPVFDAFTSVALTRFGGSFTHTPSGIPRAVWVPIIQRTGIGNQILTLEYGGVAITASQPRPLTQENAEPGAIYNFFLGANIPSGPQDLVWTVDTVESLKFIGCMTFTATANCEIAAEATLVSASATNPSVDLDLPAAECAIVASLFSAHDDISSIAAASGYTALSLVDPDFGAQVAGIIRRTSAASGPGTFSAGWTAAAAEAAIFATAIREISAPVGGGIRARRRLNPGLN